MKKYYIKQKLSGVLIALIGILIPVLDNENATFTLLALPLDVFLMVTKKQVIYKPTAMKIITTTKERLKR